MIIVTKLTSIFLVGPEGAGKSTVGLEMADILKMDFYDSDAIIEERTGVSISWIYDVEGEEGFRKREQKVIEELVEIPNIILATGGGAILTPENRTLLAAKGLVIYLKATVEQQLTRTRRKDHRPGLQVDNIEASLQEMRQERARLYEEIADLVFTTDGHSIKNIAKEICNNLSSQGFKI